MNNEMKEPLKKELEKIKIIPEKAIDKVVDNLQDSFKYNDFDAHCEYDKDEEEMVITVRGFEKNEVAHTFLFNMDGEYISDFSAL